MLIALSDAKGFKAECKNISYLDDVLAGSPTTFKSVWNLKQTVSKVGWITVMSIAVDYGFVSCNSGTGGLELAQVYKDFRRHRDADPLKLPEAAMGGRLFVYVGGLVKLKKQRIFQWLMKNLYPLIPT